MKKLFYLAAILAALTGCNQPDKAKAKSEATTDTPPDVPHMWMSDSLSKIDEDHFTQNVTVLSTQLGAPETDSIFYPLSEFKAMIDTFRTMTDIAFVDICPAADPATKKLSILYVPEDSDCNPIGYFTLPENATTFSQKANGLSLSQFQDWLDAYSSTAMKWMRSQLDAEDPDNYVEGNTLTPMYNTLHAAHFFNDFTELYDEFSYQAKLKNNLSGVEAFFSLKPSQSQGTGGIFSNRLYVILEFTTDDVSSHRHQKFHINTQGRTVVGGDEPPPNVCITTESFIKKKRGKIEPHNNLVGVNNGQLCPPACNP